MPRNEPILPFRILSFRLLLAQTHESYNEFASKFLPIDGRLGAPYGRGTAQVGVKDHAFFCFLCEAALGDGAAIEEHLLSEEHEAKILEGESEPLEGLVKEEEGGVDLTEVAGQRSNGGTD